MKRVPLTVILALGILMAPLAAEAQPTAKVPRIGYLSAGSPSGVPHLLEAFRQGLRELGWVEGQNIIIDYRYAEGRFDRLPDLAAELVRLKVDVIVAAATAAALAAKNATGTIPTVMIGAYDPVERGLVASLARPGGKITGLTFNTGLELVGKYLELLKEVVPKVSRVAVLWNPANPGHAAVLKEAEGAARALRVRLQTLEARVPQEIDSAFEAMIRERADALLVLPDPMPVTYRARIADLAAKTRLPTMFGYREHVDASGLMSYGVSLPDLWRRSARYVDKILKGAKPADLPVEQPTKFELVINLKTAKALGLTIPPSVLIRADQVIQ